jgi:uncharacterized membrane protein YdfJ with MMPL/SSD domain
MNDRDAERVISLLEQIRDNQKLQLERQTEALDRQSELLARQRQHVETLSKQAAQAQAIQDRAELIQAKSAQVVGGARTMLLFVVPLALLVLVFVCWLAFGRVLR